MEDETGRLRLTRIFQLFGSHPFARTWAMVENTSGGEGDDLTITDAAILQLAFPGLIDGQPLTLMHVEQFCWRYHKDFFTQHQFPFVEGLTPAELRMGSFPCPLQRHQQLCLGGGAGRTTRRGRTEPPHG